MAERISEGFGNENQWLAVESMMVEQIEEQLRNVMINLENSVIKEKQIEERGTQSDQLEERRINGEKTEKNEDERKVDKSTKNVLAKFDSNLTIMHKQLNDIVNKGGELEENRMNREPNEEERSNEKVHTKFDSDLKFMQKQLDDNERDERRQELNFYVCRIYKKLFIFGKCNKANSKLIEKISSAVEKGVDVRHQWYKILSRRTIWEGAVVDFKSSITTIKAKRIFNNNEYLTAVTFSEMVEALIEAEIRHPGFDKGSTVLRIKGKSSMPSIMRRKLQIEFRCYGKVLRVHWDDPESNEGCICRVFYKYASHALIAKLVFNQAKIVGVGKVSAEVNMTSKETSIMGYMKDYLRYY